MLIGGELDQSASEDMRQVEQLGYIVREYGRNFAINPKACLQRRQLRRPSWHEATTYYTAIRVHV